MYFNKDQWGHGNFVVDSESLGIIMETVEERCGVTKFKTSVHYGKFSYDTIIWSAQNLGYRKMTI